MKKLLLSLTILLLFFNCNEEIKQNTSSTKTQETAGLKKFTSMQMTGVEQISIDVDLDSAPGRLQTMAKFEF